MREVRLAIRPDRPTPPVWLRRPALPYDLPFQLRPTLGTPPFASRGRRVVPFKRPKSEGSETKPPAWLPRRARSCLRAVPSLHPRARIEPARLLQLFVCRPHLRGLRRGRYDLQMHVLIAGR
jgi:hypothetical protein